MLNVRIDKANNIAILEPDGPLSESDFISAAGIVDSMIEESGRLNGIVVHTKSFPGWNSLTAFSSHLRFVKDHQKWLSRIALATDSKAANFAEVIAKHFVSAEMKIFSFQDMDKATQWVIEGTNEMASPLTIE